MEYFINVLIVRNKRKTLVSDTFYDLETAKEDLEDYFSNPIFGGKYDYVHSIQVNGDQAKIINLRGE